MYLVMLTYVKRVGSVFAGTLAEHYWLLDPRFAGLVRLRRG